MKQMIAAVFVASCLGSAVLADTGAEPGTDDAPSLMERGAQMFLEGLMSEMQPALKDLQELAQGMGPAMQDFVHNMGPAIAELLDKVEDWSAYHPPEILPNGDIILRKKIRPEPPEEGQIDL